MQPEPLVLEVLLELQVARVHLVLQEQLVSEVPVGIQARLVSWDLRVSLEPPANLGPPERPAVQDLMATLDLLGAREAQELLASKVHRVRQEPPGPKV